ncbi:hypothetical protein [Lysinibacillus odysseyi]|uniref:Uncharacterized protein n=1 Tax=Lysinibacillus odysseyi 34hs-1 = NBRC 100172 TaxID=1220589 RepID=A0A0A3IFH2_9BACI|nr:hypothetical protein [Lysinibacillus odysseyi]KGR83511.1 hypothetical protein CD32_16950 [Lysinibacillus odysseyi 34hs-1 = NBRC 100172]
MKIIDIAERLEKIIAIYFNGDNYIVDGVELSREDSRLLAFSLIHAYQLTERVMSKKISK